MTDPVFPPAELMHKQAALLAQCPVVPPLSEDAAARLPIHVNTFWSRGQRVIFIHGGVQSELGGGPKTFARQAALVEKGWHLSFVDRPGFGQSPSRGADDMQADAIWIAEMLEGGAHLVGHSWGGADALLAAARRPEAVRSLTLVEPALHGLALTDAVNHGNPAFEAAMAEVFVPLMAAKSLRDYALRLKRRIGAADRHMDADPGALDDATAERFACSFLRARMAAPGVLREAADRVSAAKIPVLAISGGWSTSVDAVTACAARLTNGRHVKVSAPNHFVQFENREAFNATVDAFMRGHEIRTS